MKLTVVMRRQHTKTGRSGWKGPDSYIAVTSRDPNSPLYSSGRNIWWWYFGEGYSKNQGPLSSLGRAFKNAEEFVERFSSAESAEEIVALFARTCSGGRLMRFNRGDRVVVTMQDGRKEIGGVAYVRFAPPDYNEVQAVSVVLDSKRRKLGYTGTIVAAEQVEHINDVIKRVAMSLGWDALEQGCTPEHFTPGWAMSCGDRTVLTDVFGSMSVEQWQLARNAFEQTVRGHFEEVSDETDS